MKQYSNLSKQKYIIFDNKYIYITEEKDRNKRFKRGYSEKLTIGMERVQPPSWQHGMDDVEANPQLTRGHTILLGMLLIIIYSV